MTKHTDSTNCFSIIETKRKNGNYSNPYEFKRSWTVTKVDEVSEKSSRERQLEERLAQLEQTLGVVLESSSLGKGKGKRSSSLPNIDNSFLQRIRSSLVGNTEPDDDSETSSSRGDPPPYELTETKEVYIKKIDLLLNGSPLGKLVNFITLVQKEVFH